MKDRYLHSITLKIVLKLKVFKKTIGPRWPNIVSLLNQAFTLPVPARKRKNEELMQNDEPQTVDDPCSSQIKMLKRDCQLTLNALNC